MSKESDDILFKVALAAGAYFLVIRPIMNEFGVSPEDKAAVAEIDNSSPVENPFSPYFQPMVDQYQSHWLDVGEAAWFQQLQWNYDNGMDQLNGTDDDIAINAETIHNAFSLWHNLHTNDVLAVFNRLTDQAEVSLIAAYLNYVHGEDLWSLLRNGHSLLPGLIPNGIGETNMAAIKKRVDSLPQKLNF